MNQKLNLNGNRKKKRRKKDEIDKNENWEEKDTSLNVSHGSETKIAAI